MIKLTRHEPTDTSVTIRIEGRLDASARGELLGLIGAGTAPSGITLDISGVRSVDADGRGLLAELRRAGCRLCGGSLYIERLLEGEQL